MLIVPALLFFFRTNSFDFQVPASPFTAIYAGTDGVNGALGNDDKVDLAEGEDSFTALICNDSDMMRSNYHPEEIQLIGNVDDVEILTGNMVGAKSSGRVRFVSQFAGSAASKGLTYHRIVSKFKGLPYPIHCVDRYALRDISPYGTNPQWVSDPYGLLRDKNICVLTKAVKVRSILGKR